MQTRLKTRNDRLRAATGVVQEPGYDTVGTSRRGVLRFVGKSDLVAAFGAPEPPPRTVGRPWTCFWKFRGAGGQRWTVYDRKGSGADGLWYIGGEYKSDPTPMLEFLQIALPLATATAFDY